MWWYNLGIRGYDALVWMAAFFNVKAKQLLRGRKESLDKLSKFKRESGKKLAWFHCASLGEFEQARPVIESLKKQSNVQIAVSFFSPSGYEIRKNYELADIVFYLPSDRKANARIILQILQPDWVFFVKYEIWIHYITETFNRAIPLYLLSATFRPSHLYFKWYGYVFKRALLRFTILFTQDHASTQLAQANGLSNVVFSNDTRYDRVYDQCKHPKDLPIVKVFKNEQPLLVLGSSYADEEKMLAHYLKHADAGLKVVIAPHQISPQRIQEIEHLLDDYKVLRYSEASLFNAYQAQILLIDNIGLLSSIYYYADVAFIGGGFGTKGLHNMLEAATFGMPILIGPKNHARFPEAGLLKEAGVLFTVTHADDFSERLLSLLTNTNLRSSVARKSRQFIENNIGATPLVMEYLAR